jgi:hypothetical protein
VQFQRKRERQKERKRFNVHLILTGPDAIPENAGEPEGDADLDGPEHDVVGVPATQIDPENENETIKILHHKSKDTLNLN